jgi:protein tyrosine/serine phosphatase
MMTIEQSAPSGLRRAVSTAHDVVSVARAVAQKPLRRASWGALLNLPCFGVVDFGRMYRSGLPRTRAHFEHIRTLGIRTIVCVRSGGSTLELKAFARRNRIRLIEVELGAEPEHDLRPAWRAVDACLADENDKVLLLCEDGRHRTGLVVALARLLRGSSRESALREYHHFAGAWPAADDVAHVARTVRAAELPLAG